VVLARELTKKFEEYLRGSASELLERLQSRSIKGEFVVMVAQESERPAEPVLRETNALPPR
jgi:16S rRNA (cytidine1402-2'-O)-methyltransferase